MADMNVYAPLWVKLLSAFGLEDYDAALGNNNGLSDAFVRAAQKLAKVSDEKKQKYLKTYDIKPTTPINWGQRLKWFQKCFNNSEVFNAIRRSNEAVGTGQETVIPTSSISGENSVIQLYKVPRITCDERFDNRDTVFINQALFPKIASQLYNPLYRESSNWEKTVKLSELVVSETRTNLPFVCPDLTVLTTLVNALSTKFSGAAPIKQSVADRSYVKQGEIATFGLDLPAIDIEKSVLVKYMPTDNDNIIHITNVITDPNEIASIQLGDEHLASKQVVYTDFSDLSDEDILRRADPQSVMSEIGAVGVVLQLADDGIEGILCIVGCLSITDWMDWHRYYHTNVLKDFDVEHGYLDVDARKELISIKSK